MRQDEKEKIPTKEAYERVCVAYWERVHQCHELEGRIGELERMITDYEFKEKAKLETPSVKDLDKLLLSIYEHLMDPPSTRELGHENRFFNQYIQYTLDSYNLANALANTLDVRSD